MAALLILLTVYSAAVLLARGAARAYALLDDERRSAVYCPPEALANGEAPIVAIAVPQADPADGAPPEPTDSDQPSGFDATPLPCLPRRLDHAAPGYPVGEPPPAVCAVLRAAGLDVAIQGFRPCS